MEKEKAKRIVLLSTLLVRYIIMSMSNTEFLSSIESVQKELVEELTKTK